MRSRSTRRDLPTLLSQGEEVRYVSDGTTLTATADGRIVFTLTVNPDGSWSFDLEDQLDHVLDSGDAGTLLQTTGAPVAGIDFSALIIATDFDGDAAAGAVAGSFVVTIENDVPVANEDREAITIDVVEDALSTTLGDPAICPRAISMPARTFSPTRRRAAIGSLDALFNVGADEPLTYALSLDTSDLPALLSQGEEVSYVSDGTTLTATAGGRTVFTLTVNPDGSWSFDLEDQLDHVLDSGDTGTLLQTTGAPVAGIDFSALIIATDFDGDATAGAVAGSFVVTIENDVPAANEDREAITIDVVEDALSTTLGDLGDLSEGNLDAGQDLLSDEASGGHRLARRAVQCRGRRAADLCALARHVGPADLALAGRGGQLCLRRHDADRDGGRPHRVHADGQWRRLVVVRPRGPARPCAGFRRHRNAAADDGRPVPSIDFSALIIATDFDGDAAAGAVAGSFVVTIENDVPVAAPDTDTVGAGGTETGNVITDASPGDAGDGDMGADSPGADEEITVTGVAAGDTGAAVVGGVGVVIDGLLGELTLNADGSYSYTADPNADGKDVFTYTITDADGDTATTTLTITVEGEPIDILDIPGGGVTVDEDGFPFAADDTATPRIDETNSTESTVGTVTITVGFANTPADLPGSIALIDSPGLDGQLHTLDGQSVTFALDGDELVGTVDGGSTEVLRLAITDANETSPGVVEYTLQASLLQPLKHLDGNLEESTASRRRPVHGF